MRRKLTGSILAAALIMCTAVSGMAGFVPAGEAAVVEAAADKSDKNSETNKDDSKKDDSKSEKEDSKKDDSKSEKEDSKKDDSKSEKEDSKKDDSKSEKADEKKDDSKSEKDDDKKEDSKSEKDDDKKEDSKSEKDDDKKEEKSGKYSIETKKVDMYYGELAEKQDIELAFIDGVDDVPYLSAEAFRDLYVMLLRDFGAANADLKLEKNGAKVTFTRESGYPVVIDFAKDTISFHDYDAFMRKMEQQPLLDTISATGFNDKGEPEYFQLSESSFDRYGDAIKLKPGDYGIDLVNQDGKYYLPLQLVSDIFLSEYSVNVLYNTKSVFIVGGGDLGDLADEYYIKDAPKERSNALIDFNYNELCFALDNIYGLKAQHQIDNFDDLFKKTGLIQPLHSKSAEESNQAVSDLLCKYFDDGHSGGVTRTYMTKEDPKRNWGPTRLTAFDLMNSYSDARKKNYPDGPEPYEEIGNTAFITFDTFLYLDVDYYGGEKPEDNLEDTVGLMLYSYDQITRKDSPIENVVLDLSNNGGGMADAAAFVLGTFLGEGSICMNNPTTGALCSENFRVDLNLDRKFDDKDSLKDYKLFCIESPSSFSCGNLVPSAFKSSHKVTLLGQTSGGGACVVHRMSTADGALFQMSGPKRLAYMKNGSFYDIDQGAVPDFMIPDPELLYDRKYMADYVNNLLGK